MDNSLTRWKRPFFKILFSRNSQSSVWNTNIFPDKVYQFFALRSHYTGDTAYRVWFDLDNSLTRWKRIIFKILKIRNSRNSQNSVWKRNFFPGRAILRIIFPLHFHYSGYNQCRVWFYLHNSLTRWKRIIFKIRYSRNSQNFVWEPNLFPRQALRKFFALHSHYTGDTPYCVWFDLDNSLTQWKRPFFKILFSRNSKSSVWNTNIFPDKVYQFFALRSHYTGDTAYRVWFDLDNSMTRWKRIVFKILKTFQFAKFENSVWKPIFFS